MITETKDQEIQAYRTQIKILISTIDLVEHGQLTPEVLRAMIAHAHWTLDKYSESKND